MTTELEQVFFNCFEIPKRYIYLVMDMGKSYYICDRQTVIANKHLFSSKSRRCYVKAVNKVYPEITDRILLKLIFWLIQYEETFEDSRFENIEEFKKYVIIKCISIKTTNDKWLAKQIQQLFKEEE